MWDPAGEVDGDSDYGALRHGGRRPGPTSRSETSAPRSPRQSPLGASVATEQPQDNVRVLLDPADHPCCLCRDDG